jgi:hypothetical protein
MIASSGLHNHTSLSDFITGKDKNKKNLKPTLGES